MTPLLHPYLVNGRGGDPALYVEFLFEKRALLFDLGDLHPLSPRKILRLSDIFVSHTHIDHFIGFDQVLRVLLGRQKTVRLYGPAGFIDQLEQRLGGYAWNLAERFSTDLTFQASEVRSGGEARAAVFRLQNRFRREPAPTPAMADGVVLDEEGFRVRLALLDHRIPCLAFAVEETAHVNIWKNRLDAMGLPTGPWLRELKQAVLRGAPDDTPIRARWRQDGEPRERLLALGELKRRVLKVVPGQKIAYVVDAVCSYRNARRIVDLARDADLLFIEAAFADADADRAADRYHLTTAQAGRLGRLARVSRLEPFHFSPRYAGEEAQLMAEVEAAFEGKRVPVAETAAG